MLLRALEGFDALKAEREGKITLRATEIDIPKPIKIMRIISDEHA
jgi:hypothetical protein